MEKLLVIHGMEMVI